MAGKLVVDTIDTDNAFITLNVQQSLIATMNVSGIYSNTGVQMIGANGTVSNTAITGLITASQIANVANTQITGNLTATTSTNLSGGGANTVVYQSAAGTTAYLTNGTTGQFLAATTSGAPTWGTPSAGALVLLSTVTASSSATVDVETTFNSTYDAYLIVASGVISATDGTSFDCRLKLGGTYATSSYSYHSSITSASSTSYSASASDTAAGQILITSSIGNTTADSLNFTMTITDPSSTTKKKVVYWTGGSQHAGTSLKRLTGAGSGNAITALTGVRFLAGSGNITSGTFRLYGIINS